MKRGFGVVNANVNFCREKTGSRDTIRKCMPRGVSRRPPLEISPSGAQCDKPLLELTAPDFDKV